MFKINHSVDMTQSARQLKEPHPDEVLAKAILRAAGQLGLTQIELGAALGLHRTGISRMKTNGSLDPNSKQGEIALLIIRLTNALHAITGGDTVWMRHFMHSENDHTGGIPAKQIETIQGLMDVLRFVDGISQ